MSRTPAFPATAGDINIYHARRVADQQITFVVEFNTRLDLARLAAAHELLLQAAPVLACRLVVGWFGMHWQPVSDYQPWLEILTVESESAAAALVRFTSAPGDPERQPILRLMVLRVPDGDRLCVKVDHVVADAGGVRLILNLLAEAYATGQIRQVVNVERGYAQILQKFSVRATLRNALRVRLPTPGESIFSPGFAGEAAFIERISLEPDVFQRLRATGKVQSATINDLVIASTYRAVFRSFHGNVEIKEFPLMIPVDMRRNLPVEQRGSVANLTSALYPQLSRVVSESPVGTLQRVKKLMGVLRADAPGQGIFWLMRIASVANGLPLRLGYRNFDRQPGRFVNCSNVGALDEVLQAFGLETICQAYVVGSIQYAPGILTAVASCKEHLHLVVQGLGSHAFHAEARRFLELVGNELHQYARLAV